MAFRCHAVPFFYFVIVDIKRLKEKLMARTIGQETHQDSDFLSTGSALLDLACSDNVLGGFIKGKFYLWIGDSGSGKTFGALTIFAEAARNKSFKDYRFIYDNVEDGALMDFSKYFGKKAAKRIESPIWDEKNDLPQSSTTVEEFYYNLHDASNEGPCIYVLDSMDALSSQDEEKKFAETKDAHEKGRQVSGTYGDGKAKKNSQYIRKALQAVRKNGSILIIICQTRDNFGFGFETKTRSGGKALGFYASLEIWMSKKKKLKKTFRGKERQTGILTKVQLKKNRITGKDRTVEIPIYHSIGIDDVGTCVDWLVSEKHWKTVGNKIIASDFDLKVSRNKLIAFIEKDNKVRQEVYGIMQDIWDEIESSVALERVSRYE